VSAEIISLAEQKRLRTFVWRLEFIQQARAAALDAGDAERAMALYRQLLDLQREVQDHAAA
jgi:hypothetical protein